MSHLSPTRLPVPDPEERRGRRLGRSRRFLVVMACLGVLGLAIQVGAVPAYRYLKTLRARNAAHKALEFLAAGRLEEAARQSRLGHEFAPEEPDVLRVVARLSGRLQHPDALNRYQTFIATGRAEFSDRFEMLEIAVRTGRTDLARPLLAALLKEAPTDRRVWRLAQQQVRQLGDLTSAVRLARTVVSRFEGESEAGLELASLLLLTGETARIDEALHMLWGLAVVPSPNRLRAVALLANRPDLKASEAETLARLLDGPSGSPAAPLTTTLLSCQLRLRSHPEKRSEWLALALHSVPTNGPVSEVCELVLWLGQQDAIQLSGFHLPVARCRTNFPLMAARLDYLIGTGGDQELEQVISDLDNVLDPGTRAAVQGSLAAKRGRLDEAEVAFRGALNGAGSRSDVVASFVAREAERYGMNGIAVQALQSQMDRLGAGLEAARRILRVLRTEPDLHEALVTLRRLHGLLPGDDTVALERAWLELFLGENSEWALAKLKGLTGERPLDASLQPALALAQWRMGNHAEALNTIERTSPDPERMSARERVVYALVLGANNRREAARRVARMIPRESMRKQFDELLAPLL